MDFGGLLQGLHLDSPEILWFTCTLKGCMLISVGTWLYKEVFESLKAFFGKFLIHFRANVVSRNPGKRGMRTESPHFSPKMPFPLILSG